MLFNTLTFVLFHFVCVFFFWSAKTLKMRNTVLLFASLFFYGWYYWPALFILVALMVFNYFIGQKIELTASKKILTIGVVVNLFSLFFFKYSTFLAETIVDLFAVLNITLSVPTLNYWLPLGISFYTFQIVAYLVDVYRKEIEAEKSFVQFAVFMAFYGQLIAGPIVRAKDFLPQLKRVNVFKPSSFQLGLYYLIAGLFIKVVVADTLSQFVDFGFQDPTKLNALNAWGTLYGFSFQILADFWGYSTIAIGVGYMYGIELPINFNSPYIASTLRDFWRRWHITLSIWLRDYLYIPLGGNKASTHRNLFLTMALGGLWHGASWNFVLWGSGHGMWLILERMGKNLWFANKVPKILKWLLVFNGVSLLWVFFRATDLPNSIEYFRALTGSFESTIKLQSELINQIILFVVFCFFFSKSLSTKVFLDWSSKKQITVSVAMLLTILSFASAKLDFIYFVF